MIFIAPAERSLVGAGNSESKVASETKGYDIIGDVHGCGLSLELLLGKLGYSKRNGVYSNPGRQVIFLGDIIDRGPRIRESLHLVYDMVQAGHAQIVMGNHEFNYLSYVTRGQEGSGLSYLREHNPRHHRIVAETLEQFANYPDEEAMFLQWIREMPVYLEFEHFRVVHACWHQKLVDRFEAEYPNHIIDNRFLHRSSKRGTFEWALMDRLLRGTHLRLPDGEVMVSKDGFERRFFRTKFWAEEPEFYGDVVFQPDPLPEHVARLPLTEQDFNDLIYYGPDEKMLFIGHYWREGVPAPITSNIACLDYSAVKYGKLVAYRLDAETTIQPDKFVFVDVRKEIADELGL
ncbi:MAG: serine/threonine protein phosphatase [Oceanospirillaceae bacterium]|nr:serine/threonine protein phosphatase [Oceanospirillaceae bacterium]